VLERIAETEKISRVQASYLLEMIYNAHADDSVIALKFSL